MYSSRKTKVRFGKGSVLPAGLTGLSLGPGETARASLPVKPVPAASPPSPLPPSPTLESEIESDGANEYDEYTQHAKKQAKNKLESITGRLFQVLNDYEDDHTFESELKADLQERNNIQSMITDYRDTCTEREDLLTSLAEWFEDDHIDDMIDDIGDRRLSEVVNTGGLRASLMEGKQTSLKLKAINERIQSAENRGLNTEQLKLEKEELEKQLMTKINLVDELEGGEDRGLAAKTVSTAVTDSWKFAAVEICNMLHQVRDSGYEELHGLDDKIQHMVASMNQQTNIIDQLNSEIQQQQQMAMFADQTTIKLSNDNSLLHEEVELLRNQLIEAKHTISSLQADLHKMELKAEFESKRATAANQKKAASNKNRPKSSVANKETDDSGKYEAQISDLCMEVATLTQENNDLKLTVENVEREFDDARQFFETEMERYRVEIEHLLTLQSSGEHQTTAVREKFSNPSPSIPPPLATILDQRTEDNLVPLSAPPPKRRSSQSEPNDSKLPHNPVSYSLGERRKSSVSGKEVQLLQIKLLDKDNQLLKTQEHADTLQEQVIALEKELQSVRKENDGLMKLQEKSAALIGQASTCLQIKSEQKQSSYSEMHNHREWSPKNERVRASSGKLHKAPTTNTAVKSETIPKTTEAASSQQESIPTETKEVCEPKKVSEEGPIYWSVMGSLDSGENKFGMPEERTDEEKNAESIQLVVKLIEQVNQNEMDFANADSKALKKVQNELQKICRLVTRFVEYSSNLVNDEADVMSTAMDSLMSHLPEDEQKNLPVTGQPQPSRQGARMSLAEVKYFDRNKLKEKVVRFADQAIDVLKAGERALSTKINAQKKDLQTVLRAMTDHKSRQSTAFKYTPPDVKGLMLEAHAVSTHDISARKSHVLQQSQAKAGTSIERRKVLIERLRRFSMSQGNPILRTHPAASYDMSSYKAFKGLGSNLFLVNSGKGVMNQSLAHGAGPVLTGLNRTVHNERKDASSFLQINTTHAHEAPVEPVPQSYLTHTPPANTSHKRKKAKLFKPFHFNSPLGGESPYGTLPVKSTHQAKTKGSRKKPSVTVAKTAPSNAGDGATFFDLLTHSNNVGKRATDDQTLKLPPLANL